MNRIFLTLTTILSLIFVGSAMANGNNQMRFMADNQEVKQLVVSQMDQKSKERFDELTKRMQTIKMQLKQEKSQDPVNKKAVKKLYRKMKKSAYKVNKLVKATIEDNPELKKKIQKIKVLHFQSKKLSSLAQRDNEVYQIIYNNASADHKTKLDAIATKIKSAKAVAGVKTDYIKSLKKQRYLLMKVIKSNDTILSLLSDYARAFEKAKKR